MSTAEFLNTAEYVITRPQGQAENLLADLKDHIPQSHFHHLPLINICPIDYQIPRSKYNKTIFISPNAVECYFRGETCDSPEYFAVGESTARKIKAFSDQAITCPKQMNVEGLLEMEALQSVAGQSILIVKGIGGREKLADELIARGAEVTELAVYERKLPDLASQKAIQKQHASNLVWILTSAQAMNHLHRILGLAANSNHATKVIVSSDRLKQLAIQKGFEIVAQSASALDAQLVQCVKSLYFQREQSFSG